MKLFSRRARGCHQEWWFASGIFAPPSSVEVAQLVPVHQLEFLASENLQSRCEEVGSPIPASGSSPPKAIDFVRKGLSVVRDTRADLGSSSLTCSIEYTI